MKKVTVESKKLVKAAKPRRAAGVRVRSGIKAGRVPIRRPGHELG